MADGGEGATGPPSSGNNSANNRSSSSSSAPLDGAFLLQLLRNPPQSQSQQPQQQQKPSSVSFLPHETLNPHRDPAVAAVGTTYPFAPHAFLRLTHHHPPPPQETPPGFSPPLPSSFPPGFSRGGDQWAPPGFPPQFSGSPPVYGGDFLRNSPIHQQDGSISRNNLDCRARGRGNDQSNFSAEPTYWQNPNSSMMHPQLPFDQNHYQGASSVNHRHAVVQRPGMMEQRMPPPPPAAAVHSLRRVPTKERRDGKHSSNYSNNVDRGEYNRREGSTQSTLKREFLSRHGGGSSDVHRTSTNSRQFDQSVGGDMARNPGFFDESDRERVLEERDDVGSRKSGSQDLDDLPDQLEESLVLREDTAENNVAKHSNSLRGKDVRIDLFRGQYVSSQRVRIRRRELECRYDIDSMTPLFLAIYKSLIPADEEKGKQKQLLLTLRNLVNKEWPNAQLHLYGSCANSFGVSKSDIDICLAIDDSILSKSEILLKLADILQSDNLQNVQALTHARVPIVKMMDPVTGISCDICINNLLAVANTKLLRDYAQIDDRLRQLAFIVKHWAKSRGVNETYRGTLSSYAYVLMCIHFLQQRNPAILPCLQEMEATYVVNVEGVHCAYFDQVDRLRNFGSHNNESIPRLLWGFFHYWAYNHDYTNDVISVRTGRNISKRVKDWTRRIGNDRHLICIEDPFETSHDLGRVVDKYSIKILREEFERAADILQYDSDPSVTLFEPYVPKSLPPNGLLSD